jgi:uncharacterized protein YjbI with pentapeptide repeats
MDETHHTILLQGANAWNTWRAENPRVVPNLSSTEFPNVNFSGFDLSGVNFTRAVLSEAVELSEEQLGGADLTGAQLPKGIGSFKEGLSRVEETAKTLEKIQFSLLAACLYTLLTIATRTDVQLLTNTMTAELPIVQTEIKIIGFYFVAPFLLFGFYLYFHLYLQRLWEMIAALPARFPDGTTLDEKSYPRPLSGIVRVTVPLLRRDFPPLSALPALGIFMVVWGAVPFTLWGLCWTYLPRRDWGLLIILVLYFAVSAVFAGESLTVAWATLRRKNTLRPSESGRFPTSRSLLLIVPCSVLIAGFFSVKFYCNRPYQFSNGTDCRNFEYSLPNLRYILGYIWYCPATANFNHEDVSTKPSGWSTFTETPTPDKTFDKPLENRRESFDNALKKHLEHVKGAPLDDADLLYTRATGAFLAKANLRGATLSYANLQEADLRGATLSNAVLNEGNLIWAQLQGADLRGADLHNAFLEGANLAGCKASIFDKCNKGCLTPTDFSKRLEPDGHLHPNLHHAQFWGADLKGANFQNADLSDASLAETDLQGADFTSANLQNANLQNAQLGQVSIEPINFCEDDLNPCRIDARQILGGADLRGANLTGANLQGAEGLTKDRLTKAHNAVLAFYGDSGHDLLGLPPDHDERLKRKDFSNDYPLENTDLQGALLQGFHLKKAKLQGANLRDADLQDADLTETNLQGANLQGANLQGAEGLTKDRLTKAHNAVLAFYGDSGHDLLGLPPDHDERLKRKDFSNDYPLENTDLQEALLQGFHLKKAVMKNANLQGADLQGADLQGADLQEANLSEVVNLEVEQICVVKTLYLARLDSELKEKARKQCQGKFEKPKT